MGKKKFTPEQIVSMLREAEVLLGKGQNIAETCRGLGITEQTYYRWRKEYGGLRVDQAKRLKELEQENKSASETAQATPAVADRWVLCPASAGSPESCVELRFRGRQDQRWTPAEDADAD